MVLCCAAQQDAQSYRFVGVSQDRIFVINPEGVVKSTSAAGVGTYASLHALVDSLFPPLPQKQK